MKPLIDRDGTINVLQAKCPALYRALVRSAAASAKTRFQWERVMHLKREGHSDQGDRLAKRLLGVKGEPMSEETKEKLRQYQEEHKGEIKVRQEVKRDVRRRTKVLLASSSKTIRRKG